MILNNNAAKLKTLNLIAGLCLLVVTIIELFEERATIELEIEHGLLIYAVAHVMNSAIEIYEGVQKIKEQQIGEYYKSWIQILIHPGRYSLLQYLVDDQGC